MEKTVNILDYKENNKLKCVLTNEDIFDLFIIFKRNEGILIFNFDMFIKSLSKYRNLDKFNYIYRNLEVVSNGDLEDIIDLKECLERKLKNNHIMINPSNKSEIIILETIDQARNMMGSYNSHTLLLFKELMVLIDNDLEYGIDNFQTKKEVSSIDEIKKIVKK